MHRISVYNKGGFLTGNLLLKLSAISLIFCGIWFLVESEIILYIALFLTAIVGIIDLIREARRFGPIGDVSDLTVTKESFCFFDKTIMLSEVDSIYIALVDKKIQYLHKRNNYMQITSKHDKTYEFGILIDSNADVICVDKMVEFLKQKITDVTYDRRVLMNF
jgi:hypothetical protein